MALESPINGRERNIIFRETFNNNFSIVNNRGTINGDVIVNNGTALFNSITNTGEIRYTNQINAYNGLSIHFKIKTTVTRADSVLLETSANFNLNLGALILSLNASGPYNGQNKLTFAIRDISFYAITTVNSINDGKEHDIVCTFSRTAPYMQIYIDGILDNSVIIFSNTSFISALRPLYVGRRVGSTQYYYTGELSILKFYNKALTDAEVKLLYNNSLYKEPQMSSVLNVSAFQGVIEDTQNNTITNTAVTIDKGVTTSMKFNGSTSVLDLGDNDNFSFTDGVNDIPFSVSFWVNIQKINSSFWVFIAKRDNTSTVEREIDTTGNGKLRFLCFSGGTLTNYIYTQLDLAIPKSSRTHVVLTYDGSKSQNGMRLIKNGILQTTEKYIQGTYTGMANTSAKVQIGRCGDGFPLSGNIGRMTVHRNKIISVSEAAQLYNSQKFLFGL